MAYENSRFSLCKGFQNDSLLGIEKHCDKNHVILTFKDRGVLVYNVKNNKLVHSLPAQQGGVLTSAVVQDMENRKYIGITENMNICQWHENAEDLSDCQQIKVEQPVFKIIVSSCSVGPIAVFDDGTSSLLSNCSTRKIRSAKRRATPATQKILTCSLLEYNNTPLVCVAKHQENNLVLCISKLLADEDAPSTFEWIIDKPSKDEELLSCCFQEFGNFNLVSFWSGGSLCVTELKDVFERLRHQEQHKLTCRSINTINKEPNKCNKTRNQTAVFMEAMDSTHVCLCYQSYAENGFQDAIHIYETKFGTKQASITLDKHDKSSTGDTLGIEHIFCIEGYVCVAFNNNSVVACSYTLKESSLATALGKMAPTLRRTDEITSTNPLLCIPQLPEPSKDLNNWMDVMKTEQSTEEAVLRKLTNPKKVKSPQEFNTELRKYLDSKYCTGVNDNSIHTVKKSSLKSKDKLKGRYRLSQHFVLTILSQCLGETNYWQKEALSSVIQTRCIPGSASTDLLKRLAEKNEFDMILKCLDNIQGIPESSLVFCLQHVLEASDLVFEDEQDDTSVGNTAKDSVDDGCPFAEKRSSLLCRLLSYPLNDVFIQDSIRILNSSQIMVLLKFLLNVIKSAPRRSFSRKGSVLHYSVALDWTGWIINAHYTTLLFNSNLQRLLQDLHSCVQDQITLFEMLSRLEGCLEQYKRKNPLPAKENSGLYSVEMLEL